MDRRRTTVLAAMLALVLVTGLGVAVDRFRSYDPLETHAITPDFEFSAPSLQVQTAAKAAAPKKKTVAAKPVTRAKAVAVTCPALPKVPFATAVAVKAAVPRVPVFDAPKGRQLRVLTNPTVEEQDLHGLVRGRSKDGFWLRIQLVSRPNGATGWVRALDFYQYSVPYRIVVQRCAKKLTVFRNGKQLWQRPVAVGKPSTPTPTGEFFVDFITRMHCCAYGPMMLSVAGFSNVLYQFGKGGTGQIAIHGTNANWSVGRAASNGCVRMYNQDVLALSKMVPPGTPVTIVD